MVSQRYTSAISALDTLGLKGVESKMNADKVYKPAVLRNRFTGKREEILLVDMQDEYIETRFLAIASNPELKADLSAALRAFSPIEKRILFRVLVQGQSVREATTRMQRSARSWERWLSEKALPALRTYLEDYREETQRVSSYVAPESTDSDEEPVTAPSLLKCRFCEYVATAKTGASALKALRDHCAAEHKEQSKQIHTHVHERDNELTRSAALLKEPRFMSSQEQEGEGAL